MQPAMKRWILTFVLVVLGTPATAFAQTQQVDGALLEARAAADRAAAEQATDRAEKAEEANSFDTYVKRQSALEVQLGLRFYQEYDDYRAITALRRYRFLDGGPKAQFLSSLMIGQIYHRNEKPELSVVSFEEAARATEDPYQRTFAYLLALQEMCLPLSYYAQCRQRLAELAQRPMEAQVRELIDYQVLYTDVVLRSEHVTEQRLKMFSTPRLQEKAEGLLEQDRAFEDLKTKKPWLSGTLSAVLPGAGQLYNGRPWDGLISFGVNAAFGAATYFSFAAENIALGVVSALFTAGFYSGNIVNAVSDAKKINAERYLKFFDDLKLDYWPRVSFKIDENEVLFTYGFDWPGPTLESRAKEAAEAAKPSDELDE